MEEGHAAFWFDVSISVTVIFKVSDLHITVTTNMAMTDFLDVTLDLNMSKYYPYKRSNEEIVYTKKSSKHLLL